MNQTDTDIKAKQPNPFSQTQDDIQREYSRINLDWLVLHYKTTTGLVLFAFLVEWIMGLALLHTGRLEISLDYYILKYIFAPSVLNLACVLLNTIVMNVARVSYNWKRYVISLSFVVICFSLYTVHAMFTATIYIFAIGIMLTTLYASYALTSVTAICSIIAILIADVFIVWDTEKASRFTGLLPISNYVISLIVILGFSLACMVAIRFEKKKHNASIQMEEDSRQLHRRLSLDEMTGMYNRKALHMALSEMEPHSGDHSYILAISDIDHFKRVNDKWGHHVGDDCLVAFAKILMETDGSYTPFRYGGDEFCLLFLDVEMNGALAICQEVQSKFGRLRFPEQPGLRLSASFGLASFSGNMDAARLFTHADHALYEAKKTRNMIHVHREEEEKAYR